MRYIYILPLYFISKRIIVYLAVKRNKTRGPLFDKLYEVSSLTQNSLGYWTNLKVINTLGKNTRLPFKDALSELEYRLKPSDYEKVSNILGAIDLAGTWNIASKTFYFGYYYKIFNLSNLFIRLKVIFWNSIKILGVLLFLFALVLLFKELLGSCELKTRGKCVLLAQTNNSLAWDRLVLVQLRVNIQPRVNLVVLIRISLKNINILKSILAGSSLLIFNCYCNRLKIIVKINY